jgi:hypothetical protein
MMRSSSSATFSTTLLTWTGKCEGHLPRATTGNLLRKLKNSAARTLPALFLESLLLLAPVSFFTSSSDDEIRSTVSMPTISSSSGSHDDDMMMSPPERRCDCLTSFHMKKMNPGSFLYVDLDGVVVHELPSSLLALRHVSSV